MKSISMKKKQELIEKGHFVLPKCLDNMFIDFSVSYTRDEYIQKYGNTVSLPAIGVAETFYHVEALDPKLKRFPIPVWINPSDFIVLAWGLQSQKVKEFPGIDSQEVRRHFVRKELNRFYDDRKKYGRIQRWAESLTG